MRRRNEDIRGDTLSQRKLFRGLAGSIYFLLLAVSGFTHDAPGSHIGGIPEEELKQWFLLRLELEETFFIDYWVEQKRIEQRHVKDPEKRKEVLRDLSKRFGEQVRQFLLKKGTSYEEYIERERLFTWEDIKTLLDRHKEVYERLMQVSRLKTERLRAVEEEQTR